MRLGVVNTKGGVGKTTTCVYLAAAAHRRGLSVEVQDLDKQGSATSWLSGVTGVDGLAVAPGNKFTVSRDSAADVTIYDTSPGDPQDVELVGERADFVVIPSAPGSLNDERTMQTARYLASRDVPHAVVLVQRDERTVATRDSRAVLLEVAPVFDTEIPLREAIRRAPGTWPTGLFGYDELLDEILKEVQS